MAPTPTTTARQFPSRSGGTRVRWRISRLESIPFIPCSSRPVVQMALLEFRLRPPIDRSRFGRQTRQRRQNERHFVNVLGEFITPGLYQLVEILARELLWPGAPV